MGEGTGRNFILKDIHDGACLILSDINRQCPTFRSIFEEDDGASGDGIHGDTGNVHFNHGADLWVTTGRENFTYFNESLLFL